ncbi:MAG TPA: ArdC family protein [Candidatus Angelobacter sp.]
MLVSREGRNHDGWALGRAYVNDLAKSIESGRSEALASHLAVMARFPTYSARNVLLIAAQRPTATHIEGIRSWNELGRFVRPGEKGIFIFAPAGRLHPEPGTRSQNPEAGNQARESAGACQQGNSEGTRTARSAVTRLSRRLCVRHRADRRRGTARLPCASESPRIARQADRLCAGAADDRCYCGLDRPA